MVALAHALLSISFCCGLCRSVNPKDNYKLCVWGFPEQLLSHRRPQCYGLHRHRNPRYLSFLWKIYRDRQAFLERLF
ncbi:hypothetical protein ACFX1Z_006921 [Malus domestica]